MGGELLAIGGSDGSLTLVSKSGKIEKRVENAHSTAIICIKWNSDGQAIATCGEDGLVKIWSKLGVLRSKLAENPTPVYSLAWSPDENYMLGNIYDNIIKYPYQEIVCYKKIGIIIKNPLELNGIYNINIKYIGD